MPWLTVWENIAFHLKLKGVPKAERRRRAQDFIELVGLQGFENHHPSELSGGMNQRVGIARALLMNPSVILMDEPFAALDAQTKLEMQEELVTIWQRHLCTVVLRHTQRGRSAGARQQDRRDDAATRPDPRVDQLRRAAPARHHRCRVQ